MDMYKITQQKECYEFTGIYDLTEWKDRSAKYADVKKKDWKGTPIFIGNVIELLS